MKRSLPLALLRKRNLGRILLTALFVLVLKLVFFPKGHEQEIKHHNVLERVTYGKDKSLDVQRHDFLQRRMGGALQKDLFDEVIYDGERRKTIEITKLMHVQLSGVTDYWTRFQSKL